MWWAIRAYVKLAVLITVVCIAAAVLPTWLARITIPEDYDDLRGLKSYSSVGIDPAPFPAACIVAFKVGRLPDEVALGRVAAVAGDTVEWRDKRLYVQGKLFEGLDKNSAPSLPAPDMGPVVVPDGHVFVLSDAHRWDSLARGMIGPDVLLGKLRL